MSEEKDVEELGNAQQSDGDFFDFDDLESLDGLLDVSDFEKMGDISALGDLSDMSVDNVSVSAPAEEIAEGISQNDIVEDVMPQEELNTVSSDIGIDAGMADNDLTVPDLALEESSDGMPTDGVDIPDVSVDVGNTDMLTEAGVENSDISSNGVDAGIDMPDMLSDGGEVGVELPDMLSDEGEAGAELPDMLSDGSEAGAELPDMLSDEGEAGAELPDMLSDEGEAGAELPDMLLDEGEAGAELPDMLSDDGAAGIELPDILADDGDTVGDMPDMLSDDGDTGIELPDILADDGDTVADMLSDDGDTGIELPDILAGGDEQEEVASDSIENVDLDVKVPDILADDAEIENGMPFDSIDIDMDIPDLPMEDTDVQVDNGAKENPVPNVSEELSQEDIDAMMFGDSGDTNTMDSADTENESASGIDSMLGGILDDLDMNGSTDSGSAAEDVAVTEDTSDDGDMDSDMLNILGSSLGGVESIGEGDDSLDGIGLGIDSVPNKQEKEPGFFKRLFGNVITDEIAEAERQEKAAEEEAAAKKAEEDAVAKEEKEAAKAKAAEEKAAAKAKKDEAKAAKKAAKAEEKAKKKAEKEAQKAAEAEAAANEVVGKLNKAGVIVVVVAGALFLGTVIIGTNIHGSSSVKKNAKNFFEMKKYTQAYEEILGTNLKEKDVETYDKIITVMKVQQSLNSYYNYDRMKYYPDALNALLRGIQKYEENYETALELEIEGDLDACKEKIIDILREEYGLSEKESYDILKLDKDAYTNKVVEIATKK